MFEVDLNRRSISTQTHLTSDKTLSSILQNNKVILIMNKILYFFAILGIFTFTSCQQATSIEKLTANANSYDGQEMTVKGTVTETGNLLILKYYKIDDGSGELYIKAKEDLPQEGDKLRVTGKFSQVLKLKNQQLMGLVEESRTTMPF